MPDTTLHPLSDSLLAQLAIRGDVTAYPRGSRVITEGDASDALFILVSGRLKVFTTDGKGRELVYNEMGPGEFFGELFLDGGVRSASVAAMTDSRCVRIGHAEIRDFMKVYPEFAESLALNLVQRLRQATDQIRSLVLDDAQQRTIRFLEQAAVLDNGRRMLPKALTQQQIANRVGATREMVNQIIGRLIRQGRMAKDGGRLVLLRDLAAPDA